MKIGDYVRIKWGNGLQTISQCKNIVDMGDTEYSKDDFYIHTDKSGEVIYKTMIIKSSPNIIDLIEVGDYVNRHRVVEKSWLSDTDGEYDEYRGAWCVFCESCSTGYEENDIKSIVTKEQFESIEYKVGGKENENLNNILKDLEECLKERIEWNKSILKEDAGKSDLLGFNFHREAYIKIWKDTLDKIQELKEKYK